MKVLIIALRAPELPLRNGYDVHVYHLLRELAPNHEIHVLVPPTSPPPPEIGVTWHMASGTPDRSSRVGGLAARTQRRAVEMAPALQQALRDLEPDVVHVISGRLAPLGQGLAGFPSVLGALDASHLNARARMKNAGRSLPRLFASYVVTLRLIRTAYSAFSTVAVVSDGDAKALRDLAPDLRLRSIPNGVNAAEYAFRTGTERDPHQILFTGALNYPPNEHAAELLAREILPEVRRSVPNAYLRLVGRDPSETVAALGRRPGVEIVADVPEMAPYLSQASVFVCPMTSGTGIKNKLLEALANGLACVTTPLALQGIDAVPGRDVLVGKDTDGLAEATVQALQDADLRAELGRSGRELVERDHTWRMVAEQYTGLYEDLC